ncbi:YkvA family protein [Acidisoma sp. 7E03]
MLAGWLSWAETVLQAAIYRGRLELALFGRHTLFSLDCWRAKLALLIGPAYWLSPIDLIPNRMAYVGYLDQVGFLAAGVLLALAMVPAPHRATLSERLPRPTPRRFRTLVFCHCPKTAGTSLFRALSDRIGYKASYLMRRRRPDLALLQRRGFAFVSGHAPYDHYCRDGVPPPQTAFITFYRDPQAVLLSRFAHMLRHRGDCPARRQFFETELAARGLAMTAPEAVRLFLTRQAEFDGCDADNPQTRFAAHHFRGPLTPAHLDHAKRTFAAMTVLGSTERFDDSLRLLAYRLGWDHLSYHQLNVSGEGQRAKPDAALAAELEAMLTYDRALVAWAEARFEQDYAAMVQDCAARGVPLPAIRRLEQAPPYRRFRNRLAAACTFALDDWLAWGEAARHARRRRLVGSA